MAKKNVYELTDTAKKEDYDGFQKYSFWLTGACNANADWSNVEGQIPEVFVVWEVKMSREDSVPVYIKMRLFCQQPHFLF